MQVHGGILGFDAAHYVVDDDGEHPGAHGIQHLYHSYLTALVEHHLGALQARDARADQSYLAADLHITGDHIVSGAYMRLIHAGNAGNDGGGTGRHHNALRGERFYLVDRGGFPQ